MTEQEKQELIYCAYEMRRDVLTMCRNCGRQNGHLGGAMSAIEILAVLYQKHMNLRMANSGGITWEERDRFVMSKGHGAMAMYAALKQIGVLSQADIDTSIRGRDSVISRHPRQNTDYAIECSVGSLGQGIGYAVGLADGLSGKGNPAIVYVMVGDGECNEGSVWESAAYASHRHLNNLVVIVDKNRLQLDGETRKVLNMENMADKWKAFGFSVVEIDGHDIEQIDEALQQRHWDSPLAIIADTVKGKDIPFAENKTEWHDNFLSDELYLEGLQALDRTYCERLADNFGKYKERGTEPAGSRHLVKAWAAPGEKYMGSKREQAGNDYGELFSASNIEKWHRLGYKEIVGEAALIVAGHDKDLMLVYSDCRNRIGISNPEEALKSGSQQPNQREAGIAEQNMVAMAAGLQDSGYHVWAVAYAPFITLRVMDQLRVNLGYMQKNVCLIGLSAGLVSGDLGSTHITVEDIACVRAVPNMTVVCPCDTTEVIKTLIALQSYERPAYVRITVPAYSDQLVHSGDYTFEIEKADVLREGTDISIVACGAILADVLSVAENLEKSGISCRVVNMHTIKPLDTSCLDRCAESRLVVTVEEHSVYGGLGSAVSEYFAGREDRPRQMTIGIADRFFHADLPQNLMKEAGLDAASIQRKILDWWEENNVKG